MVCARAASHASWSQLRSQVSRQTSQQTLHGLLVSEVVAVSPLWCSLSLVLSFPIVVVGGGMVLQAVEVPQVTKHSNSFVPDQLNLLCAILCKMVLFTFKFSLSKFLSCWSLNGLESNLDSYQVMSSIAVRCSQFLEDLTTLWHHDKVCTKKWWWMMIILSLIYWLLALLKMCSLYKFCTVLLQVVLQVAHVELEICVVSQLKYKWSVVGDYFYLYCLHMSIVLSQFTQKYNGLLIKSHKSRGGRSWVWMLVSLLLGSSVIAHRMNLFLDSMYWIA